MLGDWSFWAFVTNTITELVENKLLHIELHNQVCGESLIQE